MLHEFLACLHSNNREAIRQILSTHAGITQEEIVAQVEAANLPIPPAGPDPVSDARQAAARASYPSTPPEPARRSRRP